MSILALYITDINGQQLFEYPIADYCPTNKSIQVALRDCSPEDVILRLSTNELVFHKKQDALFFLVPCTATIPALVPLEFISHLIKVLHDYFQPPLTRQKIEKNFSTIMMLLNEMIEDGYPFVTEENALRDLVPYSDSISKYLKGATSSIKNLTSSTTSMQAISSADIGNPRSNVPWRRSNVKHNNNELYVDIHESLSVIIPALSPAQKMMNAIAADSNPSASAFYTVASTVPQVLPEPIVSIAHGSVYATTRLSGIPDIQIILSFGNRVLEGPAFHPCVRLARWRDHPGTLSFVPPDGKCCLLQYTISGVESGPIGGDLKIGLGASKDEFEVRIWSRVPKNVKFAENLRVELVYDGDRVQTIKGIRASSGEFNIEQKGTGIWRFPGKTPMGWSATLRGTMIVNEDLEPGEDGTVPQEFPKFIKISYDCMGMLVSGTKVESLKITSGKQGLMENAKPYKGVKYMTKGTDIVIRG
ncbi:Mu homology domain-containing protein [Kockiozyma suomiensis]|uniref:Mu homology domain-containing protein n=1 Tax=Kockiozyma suomiensis TaxID=1337062 RepID=UPI003342FB6D